MEAQLIGDHVLLRPFRDDDASGLYEAVRESMAEVSPWLSWCHQDYSIAEAGNLFLRAGRPPTATNGTALGSSKSTRGRLLVALV